MRKASLWKVIVAVALVGIMIPALLLGGCAPKGEDGTPRPSRISIKWNTADVGSYGYSVASLMVDLLNRELPDKLEGNYVVTIHPFPATGAAMKATMEGDGHIAYTADVGMTQVYAQEAAYSLANWPAGADAELLVHSFYAYPMETSLAVHKKNADKYTSWSDLSGEPVFFTPSGYMNWLNMVRIFKALGLEFNHAEIDSRATADALRDGSIAGAAVYTTAGKSLPTYLKEAEMSLRGDLFVISPSEAEKAKLQAAGLAVMEIAAAGAFSQDVGTEKYYAVPILFAYNLVASAPAEFVRAMLEIFEENAEQLAKWEPGFAPMAADFVGMQVAGIKANPHIPVHAGMAEYLKAKNAWDNSWSIAPQE